MKGCYCLIIRLNEDCKLKIGKRLGEIEFKKGYYVYVGSAMNSLESRINRHLSTDKKLHWHVDYLLKKAEITDVIYNESTKKVECELSQYIAAQSEGVENFGSSDCNCESHLYHFKNRNGAIECVKSAYDSIAMKYKFFRN